MTIDGFKKPNLEDHLNDLGEGEDEIVEGEDEELTAEEQIERQQSFDSHNEIKYVFIADDCRGGNKNDPDSKDEYGKAGDLTGHIGILLGQYFLEEESYTTFKHPGELRRVNTIAEQDDPELPGFANPLIYIPKAVEYIWGVQCFWGEMDGNDDKIYPFLEEARSILSNGEISQDFTARLIEDIDKLPSRE
jgi:hypothetical protein